MAAEPGAVHEADALGYTALRWAGIRGHGDIAVFLARAGADPNTVGADGGTPLHGAAHHDDPEMMAALLEAGGDVRIQNQWGRTPLHVAARRGCIEVAKALLGSGADPNATTKEGWSTLNVAYRGGHPDMVALLLARGADPELLDAQGRRPGAVTLVRPEPVAMTRRQADQLVGRYELGGGFRFDIWREGDRVRLMDQRPLDRRAGEAGWPVANGANALLEPGSRYRVNGPPNGPRRLRRNDEQDRHQGGNDRP